MQLNFDASTVKPMEAMEAFPAGWYHMAITASEMKPTKDGQGAYLELTHSVLDGQYAGRKVFNRLNLRNANAQAVEIAYRELSAICHATGIMQVADSQQLHNIPMKVKVKVKPAEGQYEASNEVSAYKHIQDPSIVVGAVAGPAAAPAGAPPAPWAPPAAAAPAAPSAPVAPAAPTPAAPATPATGWTPPAGGQPWAPPAGAAAPAAPATAAAPAAPPWAQPK